MCWTSKKGMKKPIEKEKKGHWIDVISFHKSLNENCVFNLLKQVKQSITWSI